MRGKGWEERGPKAHSKNSKNSDFGTPLIICTLSISGLPNCAFLTHVEKSLSAENSLINLVRHRLAI